LSGGDRRGSICTTIRKNGEIMRLALTIAALAVMRLAHADSVVDCSTLGLSIDGRNGDARIVAYWQNKGVFPNPSTESSYGDKESAIQKEFNIDCPDIIISYDGNEVAVGGSSLDFIASKIMPLSSIPIPLYNVSGYRYPNIKQGFFSRSYGFDIQKYELISDFRALRQGAKVTGFQFLGMHDPVIGYRINGGDLKPLLFDGFVSDFKSDMKSADLIDIYNKTGDDNTVFQRISISKKANKITLFKRFAFPEK
jgi:hypothetical protein